MSFLYADANCRLGILFYRKSVLDLEFQIQSCIPDRLSFEEKISFYYDKSIFLAFTTQVFLVLSDRVADVYVSHFVATNRVP